MENKVKNVLSGIGFYGTLAVCLLVVGVCGWVLLQDREDPLPQQAVTPQVPVSQPVEMPEVRLPTVETLEPAPLNVTVLCLLPVYLKMHLMRRLAVNLSFLCLEMHILYMDIPEHNVLC